MTLENILAEYRTLATRATELRTALQSIREQLELGGSPEWVNRAKRAYSCKTIQLQQVKEELRAYRALLRNTTVEV